jgi:hypothetical protein
MQIRILLLVTLLTGFYSSRAQTVKTFFHGFRDYSTNIGSIIDTPVFDSAFIQQQQIRQCYVVERLVYYAGEKIDTIYIFSFDSLGRLTREVRKNIYSYRDRKWDTTYYPFHLSSYKIFSEKNKEGSFTYQTDYTLWQFYPDSTAFDTSTVRHRVFNDKGLVLEDEQNTTPDYGSVIFCGTGLVFHHLYRYDEKDRITFYQLDNYRFQKMRYTPKGRMIRIYDAKTGKFLHKYFVKTTVNINGLSEEDDIYHVAFEWFSPGSKLVRHISCYHVDEKETVTHFDFLYERVPLPATKDLLTISN